ncbi:MAG: ABC transporter permease [Chloroflexi bacterium]|nr:ABC transporter permease [Chloroflexota bacterium]
MKKIWVVFIKEFLDIVRDRRRIILTLISIFIGVPLLLVLPYGFIFGRMVRQTSDAISIPVQGMEYAPALIQYLEEEADIKAISAQNVRELVLNKEYAVGLIVPPGYEEKIRNGQTVEVILIADERRSIDLTRERLIIMLNQYESVLLTERLQKNGLTGEYLEPLTVLDENVASETETTGSLLGLLIPGVILSFGLGAGMPVAVAAVAGEKKKLTLEPVLFTTISRFDLVVAKFLAVVANILATFFLTMLSIALSLGLFILVSSRVMPREITNAQSAAEDAAASAKPAMEGWIQGYHIEPLAIGLFLLAPLIIVFLSAALQIMISSWARNDEEANTYLMPFNFLSGGVFFIAFFLDEFVPQLWHYAIPIFGTMLSMRDLLSDKIDPASLTVMFVSSILYAAGMLALAVWMFHREEVVFRT